jgi:hypothetical protein
MLLSAAPTDQLDLKPIALSEKSRIFREDPHGQPIDP